MEFIVEKNCYNAEAVNVINLHVKPFLDDLINVANLTTLDYFVIADSEEKSYGETVMKYASIVGTEAHVTQDGYYFTSGKALCGLDKDGKLHQAIIIRSSVWVCAAFEYLRAQGALPEEILGRMESDYISLPLIVHEIGHIIDHENQYKMFGAVNTKIAYDLRYEYEEYVTQMALSLWGEYYSEAFAFQVVRSEEDLSLNKETELINCIRSYSLGPDNNALLERTYRILYYFVIRLAFVHQHNNYASPFDYGAFEQKDFISDYIPLLIRTELAIVNLYRDYPKWDSYDRLNELSLVIKDFFDFERRRRRAD